MIIVVSVVATKTINSFAPFLPTTLSKGFGYGGGVVDSELGEEVLSGEANLTDLWSVQTLEDAVGKFG